MTKNNIKIDFFGDGMRIFLNYIDRQYKKNKDYVPHPIIRAFECAVQWIDKLWVWEHTMWVSQDWTKESIYQSYIIVLEKKDDNSIDVKEILEVKRNRTLPLDLMIILFRIQIHLDKIKWDIVNPQQMVDILNNTIEWGYFYALWDRRKEALDLFKVRLESWDLKLPREIWWRDTNKVLSEIKHNTPWEDYDNSLRAFIWWLIIEKINDKNIKVVITSPTNSEIEKYKVWDTAVEFLLWEASKYFKN